MRNRTEEQTEGMDSEWRKFSARRRICRALGRLVTILGLAAAGLLVIPAGILFLLIVGLWTAADRLSRSLNMAAG